MSTELKIEQLLAREKEAILTGRFHDFADISDQKLELLRSFAENRPDRSTLDRLRAFAPGNATLLEIKTNPRP